MEKLLFLFPKKLLLLFSILTSLAITLEAGQGTDRNGFWQDKAEPDILKTDKQLIDAFQYRTVFLDGKKMQNYLFNAPLEFTSTIDNLVLYLPLPDGEFMAFEVFISPVIAEAYQEKYPEIHTYSGQGLDEPSATCRFGFTRHGFHAILHTQKGMVYIDPFIKGDTDHYTVYYRKDYYKTRGKKSFECAMSEEENTRYFEDYVKNRKAQKKSSYQRSNSSAGTLQTYRTAISTTGEYAALAGGTVADAAAAIVTVINKVNSIYEKDFAIRFEIIANNDDIIYTNATTDPYDNGMPLTWIDQTQITIDNVIGDANYDIGHCFGTGGTGYATLNAVCWTGNKASGVSGGFSATADAFAIDLVSHEIGHQCGGTHSFNSVVGACNGNRFADTAWEPGSGSTIMSYAGTCNVDNLQNNSDPYFHVGNIEQIKAFMIDGNGANCADITNTGNSAPTSEAGINYIIPLETPFTLTGEATDPDSDAMTYCWEQFDLGPEGPPNTPTGDAPIFRSFEPTTDVARTFPKISDIVNNAQTLGEILPTYARTMHFKFTVRDNNASGGCTVIDQMELDVTDQAGPFLVTAPNTNITWTGLSDATVTWDVANTDVAPVNCANVDILLSTDGGYTYPTTLATSVPNNGSALISVPNINTTTARVKVMCSDNVFFDISNNDFTIEEGTEPDFSIDVTPLSQEVCMPDNAVYTIDLAAFVGFNESVTLSVSNNPAGTNVSFDMNSVTPPATVQMTIGNTAAASEGSYNMTITGTSASKEHSIVAQLLLFSDAIGIPVLTSPADGSIDAGFSPQLSWTADPLASSYDVEIATDANFSNIVETDNVTSNMYETTMILNEKTTYHWRVRSKNKCTQGQVSDPFSFKTGQIGCIDFNSTDVPVDIPTEAGAQDNELTVISELTITENGNITEITVPNVNITHTWAGDIRLTLKSPAGTEVQLIDVAAYGCNGGQENLDIGFDDNGTAGNPPCPPTDGLLYQPNQALSNFIGEEAKGVWQLIIRDGYAAEDDGTLNSWSLNICGVSVPAPPEPTEALLSVNVFLEGPFDEANALMFTHLLDAGLVPLAQPFNTTPWNYTGTESVADANAFPAGTVDWALLEIRDATDKTNVLFTIAGLILSDGTFSDVDGNTNIDLFDVIAQEQDFYVSIKSRNHLAVITSQATQFNATTGSVNIDFTKPGNVQGNDTQLADLNGTIFGLFAGDMDGDGNIIILDLNNLYKIQASFLNQYVSSDINMDKIVSVSDFNVFSRNVGKIAAQELKY